MKSHVKWNAAINSLLLLLLLLLSITQNVTIAHIPYAINSESMNVAPQCERWKFKQNDDLNLSHDLFWCHINKNK